MKIDYDRGVMKRSHPAIGMDVYMYLDEPGIYLTGHAQPLDEKFAREAGFDTVAYAKEAEKRKRMAQAKDAIEKELALADASVEEKVVKLKAGFKLVDIGLGRHQVKDPDGNVLHDAPLPLVQAQALFDALTTALSSEKVSTTAHGPIKAQGK